MKMKQKQLFTLEEAQAQKLNIMPSIIVRQVSNEEEALTMMVSLSGSTHEGLGNEIGSPRETVSRFINGNGGLSFIRIIKLINASGNLFLLQVMANYFGYELTPINKIAQRKADLLAELQSLENAA